MKSFFKLFYGGCSIAMVILLAAGCTTPPASAELETEAPDTETPVVTPAPASVECPPCDTTALRTEDAQLQRQLEEQTRLQKLIDDLARYPGMNAEETRRTQSDLNGKISTMEQDSGNGNRIRLAFLLSLNPAGVNDQRAMSLLDAVAKNEKTAVSLRRLAGVLRVQIQEKQRALQKLDALRDVDRRLLDERMPGAKTAPAKATPEHP